MDEGEWENATPEMNQLLELTDGPMIPTPAGFLSMGVPTGDLDTRRFTLTDLGTVVPSQEPDTAGGDGGSGSGAATRQRLTGNCRNLGAAEAQFTQDARCNAHANWNIFPLMLLACSVNTPIDDNRSHLLALRCASRQASCVN